MATRRNCAKTCGTARERIKTEASAPGECLTDWYKARNTSACSCTAVYIFAEVIPIALGYSYAREEPAAQGLLASY